MALEKFLNERRRYLIKQINEHRRELAQIRAAKGVLGIAEASTRRTDLTIQDMIADVLQDREPTHVLNILNLINEKFDRGLVRTSLSPQLSRMRQNGKIG